MNAGCAGKTVRSLENACLERLRGVFTTRRHTNPRLPLPLPLRAGAAENFIKLSLTVDIK